MAQQQQAPAKPDMPTPETLPAMMSSSNSPMAIVPTTIAEVQALAAIVAAGGWAPKSYREEGKETGKIDQAKVALGILHGMEVGLKPLQSLQNIAVINGMPSIYGDAALGLCRASGLIEDFKEEPIVGSYEAEGVDRGSVVKVENAVIGYKCTVKRKDTPTPTVQQFTMKDAARAGLLSKQGPWQQYRQRMFQMRARAWALRDACPEVLKGLMLAEEAIDHGAVEEVVEPQPSGVRTAKTVAGKLDAFAEEEPTDAVFEDVKEEPAAEAVMEDGVELDADTLDEGVQAAEPDLPEPPADVLAAFEAFQYAPFIDWLRLTMDEMSKEDRQRLADQNAERLRTVAARSAKNLGVVANFAAKMEFHLKFPEADNGQG